MSTIAPTWVSPRGDVQLYCGDCLEILPTLEAGSVDAVITDPPYGIVNNFGTNCSPKGNRVMSFEWDRAEAVGQAVGQAVEICSPSASAFVFTGFDTVEYAREALRNAGFTVKPAAWVKLCPPPAGYGNWWPSGFELAMYAYRNSPWFGDDDPKRCNVFYSDSYRFGQPGKVDHPTQKPLGLMKRITGSIVQLGGTAIDPFMGSGTTGVACVQTGRRFLGIEIDAGYFEIARKRIEEALKLRDEGLFGPAPLAEPERKLFDELGSEGPVGA